MRLRRSNPMRNPVLIGATTVLVLVVTVVLAYNANSGLPFVATYDVDVELQNAQNLLPGNDVRLNGARVGQVRAVRAKQLRNGRSIAVVSVRFDIDAKPIRDDSTALVRTRSAIGQKYLQISYGAKGKPIPQGGTLALSQARPDPVDVDQVLGSFDDRTRKALQEGTTEFGGALAGRGADLGEAIDSLGPLLERAVPVMRNLADPNTGLVDWISALNRTSAELSNASGDVPGLLTNAAGTLKALAAVSRPELQDAISAAPPLEDEIIRSSPRIRSFLAQSRLLMASLRPGLRSLRSATPELAATLATGTRTIKRVPILTSGLRRTLKSTRTLSDDELAVGGLGRTPRSFEVLQEPIKQFADVQETCNLGTSFFKNSARTISGGNRYGTWQATLLMLAAPLELMLPANKPYKNLHINPYPNAGQEGAERECEAGNEPFSQEVLVGNSPGNQGLLADRGVTLDTVERTQGPSK